jgi:hypothetical protein
MICWQFSPMRQSLSEKSDLTAPSKIGGNALISRWTSGRRTSTRLSTRHAWRRAPHWHEDFHGSRVGRRPMGAPDSRGSVSGLGDSSRYKEPRPSGAVSAGKAPDLVIGRRNRLPHHDKASSYRTVGQAVSPVELLFTQTRQRGAIAVAALGPWRTNPTFYRSARPIAAASLASPARTSEPK